jgi:antitoxin component YwqK of YwqJK toxin-antitoxin module
MLSEQKQKLEERKYWYENGQLAFQGFYQAEKLEGERKTWYENGQLESQAFFRDGKVEGERKSWYRDGHPSSHQFFRDGKLDGECKNWYENGQLLSRAFLRNGKLIAYDFSVKKCTFLNFIKYFRRRINNPINIMLIADLAKIVE